MGGTETTDSRTPLTTSETSARLLEGFPTRQFVPAFLNAMLWHLRQDRTAVMAALDPANPDVKAISGFNQNTDNSSANKV